MTVNNDPYITKCHLALNPGSKIVDISIESPLKHPYDRKKKQFVIQISLHHKRRVDERLKHNVIKN